MQEATCFANGTLNLEYAGERIQGKRNYQEDDFGFDKRKPAEILMILADGMGGHKGGAYASECVIRTFMENYHEVSGTIAERLKQSLDQANRQLILETQPHLQGMGCTLVGVALNEEEMEWVSVGDSPLWLYSAGRLLRLNADHSFKPILQERVQCGEITSEEAVTHPKRNMLRSAVTGNKIDLIDQSSAPVNLYPGDRILLASDGIFTLSDVEIGKILARSISAKKCVEKLLNAVLKKGRRNQDNTTALVIYIPEKNESKTRPLWHWFIGGIVLILLIFAIRWI